MTGPVAATARHMAEHAATADVGQILREVAERWPDVSWPDFLHAATEADLLMRQREMAKRGEADWRRRTRILGNGDWP